MSRWSDTMHLTGFAVLVGLSTAVIGAAGPLRANAQHPTDRPDALVLVTSYADGRTVHDVVTGTARSGWTPLFPRLPGAKLADGDLPVMAIKYRRVLADGRVSIAVSVLRGRAHQQEQPVATVVVGAGDTITVDALRNVGVAPVMLG